MYMYVGAKILLLTGGQSSAEHFYTSRQEFATLNEKGEADLK